MKNTLLLFVSWKVLLFVGLVLGMMFIPLEKDYLGGGVDNYLFNPYLWSWANFDGVHYLSIVKNGYFQFEQAFFPLFPLLIKAITYLTAIESIYIATFILHAFFLLALVFFYKLLRLDYGIKESWWIILFLIFFPTSFFFASVYTESLFLFLSVACFYYARKGKWWLAGVLGMLAALTRFVGIFLFPVLLIEFLQNKERVNRMLWLFLIPVGTLLYMGWLTKTYHDPLLFFHSQPAFGANRSGDQLILLPQVFFRYLKIVFLSSFTYQYKIALLELITSLLALLLCLISFKKLRLSYALYSILCFTAPTLTGSLSSMPRYLLVIFPLFIVLNKILKKTVLKILVLFLFLFLLALFTALFTRGYWVS